jgi:hypothetical protein
MVNNSPKKLINNEKKIVDEVKLTTILAKLFCSLMKVLGNKISKLNRL